MNLLWAALTVFAVGRAAFAETENCAPLLDDPHAWLEEVDSPRSLAWVETQNAAAVARLERSPFFAPTFAALRAISGRDEDEFATVAEDGFFWGLRRDDAHPRGRWQRWSGATSETVLDLDALAAREGEPWVFREAVSLGRGSSRRLLFLSRGGRDAYVAREFDVETKTFVRDGFTLADAPSAVLPIDRDTLLVATDEGPGSLTRSGYPRRVRRWTRGTPLAEAPLVYEGEKTDRAATLRHFDHGDHAYVCVERDISRFQRRTFLLELDGTLARLPLPESAIVNDVRAERVYFTLREPLRAGQRTFAAGSLLRAALGDHKLSRAQTVFVPRANQSIDHVAVLKDRVIVTLTEDVRARLIEVKRVKTAWVERDVTPPGLDHGRLAFAPAVTGYPASFATLTYSDHLTPPTLYRVRGPDYAIERVRQMARSFAAESLEVEQRFAISRDHTRVPYFVLRPKNLKFDGTTPTVLYGYGGFEYSLTPEYLDAVGKIWLERGNVYVIANVRGGGEYGPAWHQAARRELRPNAFDDFTAVAEDLVRLKITSPRHLGLKGGSNGGLLVGAVMVRRPDLMNAVLAQVPLLDLARFAKLSAGANWTGELGDPDVAEDLEFLRRSSPYHTVRADRDYPTPFFTTSTRDDRVHPAHARKMAARMSELGHPNLFFEDPDGGHARSADPLAAARLNALEWTYLLEYLE